MRNLSRQVSNSDFIINNSYSILLFLPSLLEYTLSLFDIFHNIFVNVIASDAIRYLKRVSHVVKVFCHK